MAEYREIFGEAVQSLSSDTGTIEGQIWYDSSNNNLKLYSFGASNSFSSAPNLNTARGDVRGGGTGTAAFFAGGGTPTPNVDLATENWDGSTWTTSGNMNGPAFNGGGAFGTQTAGVAAYGAPGGGGTSGSGKASTGLSFIPSSNRDNNHVVYSQTQYNIMGV